MASYSGDQIKVRVMGFEDTALPGQPTSTGQKTAANSMPVVLASDQAAIPVTFTGGGDASAANQVIANTEIGGVTETAPASDTASSGLNGRLQRIAQRLTSLIALFPGSLGQKAKTASFPVVIASDQDALGVTGTFWQATQPVSGTVAVTSTASGTTADAVYTDTTGATAGTQNSLLKGAFVKLSAILSALPSTLGIKTAAGSLSIAPASDATFVQGAGEAHVGEVGGRGTYVYAEVQRPNDSAAYALGDAISDSTTAPTSRYLTFQLGRKVGGSGYITFAQLTTNQATFTGQLRLYLYAVSDANAPTTPNDNSAFTLLYANRITRIGVIDFTSFKTEASGSDCATCVLTDIRQKFECEATTDKIYGILLAESVFTPATNQKFFIALGPDQN